MLQCFYVETIVTGVSFQLHGSEAVLKSWYQVLVTDPSHFLSRRKQGTTLLIAGKWAMERPVFTTVSSLTSLLEELSETSKSAENKTSTQ